MTPRKPPGAPSRGVRKPRKPRPLVIDGQSWAWIDDVDGLVELVNQAYWPGEIRRRLIPWLERAAEWLEYQEGRAARSRGGEP
jgi:hypothetical protein